MTAFSRDVDILKYEAVLFCDLHFPWQELCSGADGELDGTSFTSAGQDFVSAGVTSGGVIYLRSEEAGIDNAFEVISVDSATELTVSVLRSDEGASAIGVGQGENVTYRISTFAPQAEAVAFELTQYFGIQPGNPISKYSVDDIFDTSVLQQVSVYAIIAGIYATVAGPAETNDGFWTKSLHYQKLFEKAKERCRLSIDVGDDGTSDRTNIGGSIRLVRD